MEAKRVYAYTFYIHIVLSYIKEHEDLAKMFLLYMCTQKDVSEIGLCEISCATGGKFCYD